MVLQNLFDLQHVAAFHPLQTVVKGNPGTGDGSGARTTVGLDDVAVDA